MKVNTALVTDTSRAVTEASVDAYRDKISQHVDNDWGAHAPIALSMTPFDEQAPASNHNVAAASLRFELTDAVAPGYVETTAAYIVPAIVVPGVYPPVGSPPVILRQPANTSVKVGELIHLTVYAASATPMSYQWQKASANIAGATGQDFNIPAAATTDQGLYRVIVTNSAPSGSTTSANATITVST